MVAVRAVVGAAETLAGGAGGGAVISATDGPVDGVCVRPTVDRDDVGASDGTGNGAGDGAGNGNGKGIDEGIGAGFGGSVWGGEVFGAGVDAHEVFGAADGTDDGRNDSENVGMDGADDAIVGTMDSTEDGIEDGTEGGAGVAKTYCEPEAELTGPKSEISSIAAAALDAMAVCAFFPALLKNVCRARDSANVFVRTDDDKKIVRARDRSPNSFETPRVNATTIKTITRRRESETVPI